MYLGGVFTITFVSEFGRPTYFETYDIKIFDDGRISTPVNGVRNKCHKCCTTTHS